VGSDQAEEVVMGRPHISPAHPTPHNVSTGPLEYHLDYGTYDEVLRIKQRDSSHGVLQSTQPWSLINLGMLAFVP
jgi:hypothetical protein